MTKAWLNRTQMERNELNAKINSLSSALDGNPFNASEEQLTLMREQLEIMKAYRAILDKRLDYSTAK